jgi:hypothetical protein
MASTIQIKRGTGSAVPSGLADGELAINLDSGQLYFGSGSNSISTFKFANLTVNQLTSSIVTSSIIHSSGSNIFGDASDDTHTFNGNITASGNLKAGGSSTPIIIGPGLIDFNPEANGNGAQFKVDDTNSKTTLTGLVEFELGANRIELGQSATQHVTASGNISSSGTVTANNLYINSYNTANTTGTTLRLGYDSVLTALSYGKDSNTSHLFYGAAITASGNISASGNIFGGIYYTNNQRSLYNIGGTLNVGDHVGSVTVPQLTASNNISSSHKITANTFQADVGASFGYFFAGHGKPVFAQDASSKVLKIGVAHSSVDHTGIHLISTASSADTGLFLDGPGNMNLTGHITTSGNISASGTVTANSIVGTIGTATQGTIDHDSLANFVTNEHIDHSGVTMTAGAGLLGGGTIAATRTLSVNSASIAPFFSSSANNFYTVGFISASGDLTIGGKSQFIGNITASGIISSSGNIITSKEVQTSKLRSHDSVGVLELEGDAGSGLKIHTTHDTGNRVVGLEMSSSGDGQVFSMALNRANESFVISPTKLAGSSTSVFELDATGNITASGNISSSGAIIAASANITDYGDINADTIRLSSTTDASVSSTGHAFQAGLTNSTNVIIDNNEIMARNNGAVSGLHVNPDGGIITFNNSVSDKVIIGSGHITASGNISASGTIKSNGFTSTATYHAGATRVIYNLSDTVFLGDTAESQKVSIQASDVHNM